MSDSENPYSPPSLESLQKPSIKAIAILRSLEFVAYLVILIGLLFFLWMLAIVWVGPNSRSGDDWFMMLVKMAISIIPGAFSVLLVISFFRIYRFMRKLEQR